MGDMPFEEGPWMPVAPSAEDEYLASLEEDPLDWLTEKQRFVVELRFGIRDGICYTQREVAALMGISLKTVWEHEQAALAKLERFRPRPKQPDLGFVYAIGESLPGRVKIGWTSKRLKTRLSTLQTGSPVRLHLFAWSEGTRELEQEIHEALVAKRLHGEWFDVTSEDLTLLFDNTPSPNPRQKY